MQGVGKHSASAIILVCPESKAMIVGYPLNDRLDVSMLGFKKQCFECKK